MALFKHWFSQCTINHSETFTCLSPCNVCAAQVRFGSALWWEVCVIATMIFNPTVQRLSCTHGHQGLEPIPAIIGGRRGTPCTSHQFNTGLTQRDKQGCSHLWTICSWQVILLACFWTVKGSQSTWREPMRPQGEQAKSTHKSLIQNRTWHLLAVLATASSYPLN